MAKAQTAFLSARHSVSLGVGAAGGLGLQGLKAVGGSLAAIKLSS
jgi:hypothetical protein